MSVFTGATNRGQSCPQDASEREIEKKNNYNKNCWKIGKKDANFYFRETFSSSPSLYSHKEEKKKISIHWMFVRLWASTLNKWYTYHYYIYPLWYAPIENAWCKTVVIFSRSVKFIFFFLFFIILWTSKSIQN